MTSYDVVVIGGGPAGTTAALRARELGASVALIERGRLGGTCTNDGCVPTRVLAKAARLARDAEHSDLYGVWGGGGSAVSGVSIDFGGVMRRVQQVVYQMHEKKQIADHMERAGVEVFTERGGASFTDPYAVRLEDGTRIEAKRFIIAAGGRARRLGFTGAELAITHHEVWGMERLPERIAIVGAAATGCQLASIFGQFGANVTLMEVAPRILAGEDALVGETVQAAFANRQIEVITGIRGVERIEAVGRERDVNYKVGDEERSLRVECVILAVGWQANTEALNLSTAGVEVDKRGFISVNDYLQTSAEHIYAAGDITGRMMLVQSGTYEGRVAAENAMLPGKEAYVHRIVPHGGFTDPEYGSVGLTEAQAGETQEIATAVIPYTDVDRAVIDDHTEGVCKLIVSRENQRILGAHIVGEQALETVQLVAAGMAAAMRIEALAELEIAYPTYAAVVGLAARQIVRELGITPMMPQWRALGKTASEWERRSED